MIELIIVALSGLIVGSFLNVVILRLNTGRSTAGRSGCMSCTQTLSWKELVPVLSFVMLRGRCKVCGSSISHQYWMVESATAILFVLVWLEHFSLFHSVFALALMSLLVVIAVYDFKHTIIPNKVVYPFLLLSFIANIPVPGSFALAELPLHFALVFVSGVLVALPLFILWLVSRGQWMGFGDVKLTLGFGFILGVYGGLMAVMLGFILGAVIGVILLAAPQLIKRLSLSTARRHFTMNSEVPFAPFLIAGFLLVFFFNVDLIDIVSTFI